MTPCAVKGCKNEAEWQIGFRLWALAMPRQHRTLKNCADAVSTLCICGEHRKTTKTSHMLTTEGKEIIAKTFAERGLMLPDFANAQLTFREIVDTPLDVTRESFEHREGETA